MTEETKNVFSINSVKKEQVQEKEQVDILYKNGEHETYVCDYFGQSLELPTFLILGQEDKSETTIMIAVDTISKLQAKAITVGL